MHAGMNKVILVSQRNVVTAYTLRIDLRPVQLDLLAIWPARLRAVRTDPLLHR